MTIQEVKSDIMSKKLRNFYIFTGEEWQVQNIYIHKMSDLLGGIVYADSFLDIYDSVRNKSLFSVAKLYIVRDDKELMTSEKLQSQIANGLLGKNTLILLVSSVDKRTKFYTKYKSITCEFEPLQPPLLKKYIKKEINLSDKNCDALISVCENNYGRILLEIDKIKRYADVL